jgi:tRNA(Ile)-lysidine synthase
MAAARIGPVCHPDAGVSSWRPVEQRTFVSMQIAGRIRDEVARALSPFPRVVVAVSGGLDSMTLLDAVGRVAPERVCAVAVFDHRTGPAAHRAVQHVRAEARSRGLSLRVGVAPRPLPAREAAWRDARWRFFRDVAHEHDAQVATGHTRDDHVETIFMRALRDSGARGLAALHAGAGVVRPLLSFTRAELESYAAACGLRWVDDPSNASLSYARNRARLELLPAFERVQPGLTETLLSVSHRAWQLRQDLDRWLDLNVVSRVGPENAASGFAHALEVARSSLASYDADQLQLLWPALAARVGLALDRRGTERLAAFTITGQSGARIQLSGRFEAVRVGETLVVRRANGDAIGGSRAMTAALSIGGWRFRRVSEDASAVPEDLWSALLPRGPRAMVRAWRAGDRMMPHGATVERRLKGLFRDAGVDAVRRRAWPVVLVGERIEWVPGVRRSSAATVRSGRPMVLYRCERDDC